MKNPLEHRLAAVDLRSIPKPALPEFIRETINADLASREGPGAE